MAATYGTLARLDYGSRTNTTQAIPASTANGNLLLWHMLTVVGSGTCPSVTFPAGWTTLGSEQTGPDAGTASWKCRTAWRIAASEPANYTATHTVCSSESLMIRVTGTNTLSIDAYSQGTQSGMSATMTAPSVTPTATNDLLIFISLNWDDEGLNVPTGMTERQDSQTTYLATEVWASSSATGTRSTTHANGPWYANLFAIKDAAAAYSITAVAGSYALTGTVTPVRKAWKPTAVAGSYAFTGTATPLLHGWRPQAVSGSYVLTGTPAALTKTTAAAAYSITAVSGSYSMVGSPVTLNAPAGPPPLFRSVTTDPWGSGRSQTLVDAPPGVVNGDILIAGIVALKFGASVADGAEVGIVPPAGWARIGTPTSFFNNDLHCGSFYVFWKRAASEPASYTFTHTHIGGGSETVFSTQVVIAAYDDCVPGGTPVDAFSQNVSVTNGSTATILGITTTVPATKLIYVGHNWDAGGCLPPTGMTERFDDVAYLADVTFAGPGSTGGYTQTLPSSNPWSAFLIAIKPAWALSSWALPAEPGSYAFTGSSVELRTPSTYSAWALHGSYNLTGDTVTVGRGLFALAGSYSLTGSPATLIGNVPSPSTGAMSVWTGTGWVDKPVKVWDGSNWLEKPVKIWNGSAWT